jgi:hypothetical protein
MDGQESLWETMKLHLSFGPRTVPILDIVHALAYLWEAAGLFEKDEDRRRAFTRERLLRILRGESQGVIKGLRRLGTTRELQGEAAKDLARICGYLEKHSDRMKSAFLEACVPVASVVPVPRSVSREQRGESGIGETGMLPSSLRFSETRLPLFLTGTR